MQYVITDYGAESGGKTLCTAAVQAAVDACAADGGGTVVVPAGTFLIGTVWLKSRVELHLQHGAVLKASADLADYNDENAYPQNFGSDGEKWCGKHLIIALEQTDVAVTGDGTIEGCADTVYGGKLHYCSNSAWREGYYLLRDGAPLRPGPMVCFVECDRVRVTGVTLRGATCWNLLLHGCYYATLTGLTIRGDKQHVNTDGVDLDTCRYVTVSDCIIDTGDDALAMTLHEVLHQPIERIYLASDLIVLALSATYLPLNRLACSLLTVILSGQLIGLIQRIPSPLAQKDEELSD